MNNLTFISDVIYALKQEYGNPITLKKVSSQTVDIDEGTITDVVSTQEITKAVVLPIVVARSLFPKGVTFDTQDTIILIDNADLGTFVLQKDDYVIFKQRHYLVNVIHNYIDKAWLLIIKESIGNKITEEVTIEDTLAVTDTTDDDS